MEYISLTELAKEIFEENHLYENSKESFERIMRKKFNFLTNHIVMRSKLSFRFKGKDMIPQRDKSIVKALLEKSYINTNSGESDNIYVDWFNGKLNKTDVHEVATLLFKVDTLIRNRISEYDFDLDDVTKDEWMTAIESSLDYPKLRSLELINEMLTNLSNEISFINNSIPFGDMISENEFGQRWYIFKRMTPHFKSSSPLADSLQGCFTYEDYSTILIEIIKYMYNDANRKLIDLIKAYAVCKNISKVEYADDLIDNHSLASEYIVFFQNIYEYLQIRPDLVKEIENETNTENLLKFFKMKDRNGK